MKIVRIGQQEIGDGHPCYILAEAGCNHNQRLDVAKKLIDMAVRSGVDSIKFQTYKAELMYSKKTPMMKHFKDRLTAKDDATMYDLIKMTELPYDMHAPIVNYCKKNNIPFLSTPFDEESLDFLDGFDVPAYKIAAFEMTHFPLLRKVAQKGKPIILSTGMSSLGDIEKAIEIIYRENNNQVVLLHCVSNYPAQPEDYNLRVINTLKAAFGLPVGLSDHTFGIEVSKIAISIGANLIEKHITIDQKLPGPDHYFSLTKEELTELTQFNKLADKVLGSPIKKCTEAEKPMKNIGRRSLVAGVDIPSGTKITRAMIEVKRPGTGLDTGLISTLLGTETRRDIERDEPLSWDMFLKYPD